jgi:hypothetical protein
MADNQAYKASPDNTDFVIPTNPDEKWCVHRDLVHLLIPVSSLTYDPANARLHSAKNLQAIEGSVGRFGQRTPLVVQVKHRSLIVRKGNGTLEACISQGWTHVAAIKIAENDIEATAYAIADNRSAELAHWDDKVLADLLTSLENDIPPLELGFSPADVEALLADIARQAEASQQDANVQEDGQEAPLYTDKIKVPIYEPKGVKPALSELVDTSKTDKLLAAIAAAKLPADLEAFLVAAASRHTAFNFRKIADYYAHSEPEVQELFEQSALVIVDYDKAIENGFIKLTHRLAALAGQELAYDTE